MACVHAIIPYGSGAQLSHILPTYRFPATVAMFSCGIVLFPAILITINKGIATHRDKQQGA